jgi:hypothetical protein
MNWTAFFSGMSGAAISTGIFGIILGAWLNHRLTRGREAEARANALGEKRREESRAIAEILAEWVRPIYMGTHTNEDRWKMQATYWRNILGLDKRLIELLFPLLAHSTTSPGTNEMIVQARKVLLDLKQPDIAATELNNWLPEADKPAPISVATGGTG